MRKLVVGGSIVVCGLTVPFLWQAEACGPWYTLRAALRATFWQPFVKTIPDTLGAPRRVTPRGYFAGMGGGRTDETAAASKAYQAIARRRDEQYGLGGWHAQPFSETVRAARAAVDAALAAHPSAYELDELRLVRGKITLREGESLLGLSATKEGTPNPAHDVLRRARAELVTFLASARTPSLASEGRGWLARCHYLLGEHHKAARIYLDELARRDSVLDGETLLASLRILFPYNGSAARLAEHLDEYFDTPRHALFAINLVTNPVVYEENERRAMATVGRLALDALDRHRNLFREGKESEQLALAAMRASLYMGEPAAALQAVESLPADSAGRTSPEARWMSAVAHFLLGHYEEAEPHLLAVARSAASPLRPRELAQLGLLAVYQKLDRPVDQLLAAFRYEAHRSAREVEQPSDGDGWYVSWWPYGGWLMDLPYLLDVHVTEEQLREAGTALKAAPPLKLRTWKSTGYQTVTALYLVDYELAVRAARRGAYSEARALYGRLGAGVRAGRMGELARLRPLAEPETPPERSLRRRYDYAAFLADNPERIFFNDLLWEGLQRYSFVEAPEKGQQTPGHQTPDRLTTEESRAMVENERRFHDAQEERWQAFLVLDEIVGQAGHSALGTRSAGKAVECLDRIRTDRFGREPEIQAARTRLVAWLRE